jgi:hypothetical protein
MFKNMAAGNSDENTNYSQILKNDPSSLPA